MRAKLGEAAARVTEVLNTLARDRPTAAALITEDYFETVVGFVAGPVEFPGFFRHCVIEALPSVAEGLHS